MAHLIDKSALVAEIDKKLAITSYANYGTQRIWAYNDVKEIIDTLEVKEVDLKKEGLTWEDIPELFSISEQLKTSWWFRDRTEEIGTQVFWEEVLKRFKAQKGE